MEDSIQDNKCISRLQTPITILSGRKGKFVIIIMLMVKGNDDEPQQQSAALPLQKQGKGSGMTPQVAIIYNADNQDRNI